MGGAELEPLGRKPLQRPLLQELNAHWELESQAALKFPHRRMVNAVLPQHWALLAHCSSAPHVPPRGIEPGQASISGAPDG